MNSMSLLHRSVPKIVAGALFAAFFAIGSAPALADAGLAMTKIGSMVSAKPTFTIVVSNAGPDAADFPQLIDPLPGAGNIVWDWKVPDSPPAPAQGDVGCTWQNNPSQQVLECDMAQFGVGDPPRTIVLTGTVLAGWCGPLANTAFLGADNNPGLQATGTIDIPCPTPASGRMTGGGSIFKGSVRVTHGFELYCNANDPRQNLEINWPGAKSQNNFHLTSVTSARCIDDPTIGPKPPNAGFDTYAGEGVGSCNGQPASIKFLFTDAGEPGSLDTAMYDIAGACTLSAGPARLTKGNQQAHK